eukprot:PhF_6_TR9649/c0_g1_i1/m.14877
MNELFVAVTRAIQSNDIASVTQHLLTTASSIQQPDDTSSTSLIDQLLKRVDSRGNTLLHVAVLQGNPAIVSTLLQFGAEADVLSNAGVTPLIMASHYGNLEIVKCLVEEGKATCTILASTGMWQGSDAKHAASKQGHHAVVQYFESLRGEGAEGTSKQSATSNEEILSSNLQRSLLEVSKLQRQIYMMQSQYREDVEVFGKVIAAFEKREKKWKQIAIGAVAMGLVCVLAVGLSSARKKTTRRS